MLHKIQTTLRWLRRTISRTEQLARLFSQASPGVASKDVGQYSAKQLPGGQSNKKRGLVVVQIDGLDMQYHFYPTLQFEEEGMSEVHSQLMNHARQKTFSGRIPTLCIDPI